MKIAVACDGLSIAPFFVQCSSYMCYTVANGKPIDCQNIPAFDRPLDQLPDFFKMISADTLLVNDIDEDVAENLRAHGITVASSVESDPLTAVRSYLA